MNNIYPNRFNIPITTGRPQFEYQNPSPSKSGEPSAASPSFDQILKQKLEQDSNLSFSKHAVNRVVQRNIDLSADNIRRLNEGVKIAEQKGLNDTLILIDQTAFIVNVRNNTVVTTVNGSDLKGNVFTNIDGTVII